MKLLNGLELAGYIKERQARQVRALRQADGIAPKLAIVQTTDDPVIETYVRAKKRYGSDILIEVEQHKVTSEALLDYIDALNSQSSVHGIIIQLPLHDATMTEHAVQRVAPEKDVDGLGDGQQFTPATPMAIDWLLNGYNVTLKTAKIAIVGDGRLVGAPLAQLWRTAGYDVTVFNQSSKNMPTALSKFSVIVTAVGQANLIPSHVIRPKTVLVDAATSAEHGKIVGDIAPDVRQRDDLIMTPEKGGVGPLTVAALFDNVIRAARMVADRT